MNVDINQDVVVGFDKDGRLLNSWGEIVSRQPGESICVSNELMESILRAQELIEPEGDDEEVAQNT